MLARAAACGLLAHPRDGHHSEPCIWTGAGSRLTSGGRGALGGASDGCDGSDGDEAACFFFLMAQRHTEPISGMVAAYPRVCAHQVK